MHKASKSKDAITQEWSIFPFPHFRKRCRKSYESRRGVASGWTSLSNLRMIKPTTPIVIETGVEAHRKRPAKGLQGKEVSPLLTGGGVTDPFSPPPAGGGRQPGAGPLNAATLPPTTSPGRTTPPVAPRSFQPHFSGPGRPRVAQRRSPLRVRRRPQPKATRSVADMLRSRLPPHTPRSTQSGGTPLTQWQTRLQRFPHPSPHCQSGGSTAGPARKRPSPLRLVPPGRRADTCGGPVGDDTGALTQLGPPPRPTASVHRPAHANRRMPYSFVFHPFWVLGARGGSLPMDWYTTCLCSFLLWAARKSKFSKLNFWIL